VPRSKPSTAGVAAVKSPPRPSSRQRAASILVERDRLVAEIDELRKRGSLSRFIHNAEQLLTQWWSSSSWKAREDLLRSAHWMIRLERRAGHRPAV